MNSPCRPVSARWRPAPRPPRPTYARGAIGALLRYARAHPRAGLVGGRTLTAAGEELHAAISGPFEAIGAARDADEDVRLGGIGGQWEGEAPAEPIRDVREMDEGARVKRLVHVRVELRRLAVANGAHEVRIVIRFPLPGRPGRAPAADAHVLRALAVEPDRAHLADAGITLAIEPLNRFETDLVNTAEQCERLVNEIGMNNVGFHLDSFHMNIEEKNSGDAIRRAVART